jgi:hypothetical protein
MKPGYFARREAAAFFPSASFPFPSYLFRNPGSAHSHAPAAQKVRLAGAKSDDVPSVQGRRGTRRPRLRF